MAIWGFDGTVSIRDAGFGITEWCCEGTYVPKPEPQKPKSVQYVNPMPRGCSPKLQWLLSDEAQPSVAYLLRDRRGCVMKNHWDFQRLVKDAIEGDFEPPTSDAISRAEMLASCFNRNPGLQNASPEAMADGGVVINFGRIASVRIYNTGGYVVATDIDDVGGGRVIECESPAAALCQIRSRLEHEQLNPARPSALNSAGGRDEEKN